MKLDIEYTSFNLRMGTEAIHWTEKAEWFFKDHKLKYEIVFRTSNKNKVKYIQWDENLEVNVPIISLDVLQSYCKIYNCKFIVENDLYKIKFN